MCEKSTKETVHTGRTEPTSWPIDVLWTATDHVSTAHALPPGNCDLRCLVKPEISACKSSCNGQMVWIKEWANPNFSLRERKGMKPSYPRAAFGIAGLQTKHLQVPEWRLLCTVLTYHIAWITGMWLRHFLSHLKFNWAGPIPFIFRTNSSLEFHSLLDMTYTLWKKKKGGILSVPFELAHNPNFSQPDASGPAGVEPGSGNRCGKAGVGVKKGIGNMEREEDSRQKFSLHESHHGEREDTRIP